MKRIILLVMLAIFCQLAVSETVFSQTTASNKAKDRSPGQRADAHVRRMTEDFSLSPEQVPKVKAIMLDRIQKTDALKAGCTDKKAMQQEMKTIRDQHEAEMKAMLTPEQYSKYVQMREQEKQKINTDGK